MNFFAYIVDIFNIVLDFLFHVLETIGTFFSIILNQIGIVTDLIFSPILPSFISGFIAFVFVICVVKLILTLGGFHE